MTNIKPFYLRFQVRRFVVLFVERDGSTYLMSLLRSHPEIDAQNERLAMLKEAGKTAGDQMTWMREFFTPPLAGSLRALGFKTKLPDILDPAGVARLLQEHECRIIHLQRRNRVKAVVSRINARRLYEASGNWNLYSESDRLPPATIDPALFEEALNTREDQEQALADYVGGLHLPTLSLCYEDLLVSRDDALSRVFSLLGVRPHAVAGRPLKNTNDDLRSAVLNFGELRARYAGTRYEPMFDEVLVTPA
jgi:LPS sulfotransferase NodH